MNRIFLIASLLLFAAKGFSEQSRINRVVKEIDGIGYFATAIQTSDGNYVAVSHAWSHREAAEFCLFASGCGPLTISKLSPSGTYLWKKSIEINGDDYRTSSIRAIAEASDGYVLVGQRQKGRGYDATASALVIKLDTAGNILWKKSISGVGYFDSVSAHPGGSFTATGLHTVVKFSATGHILWKRHFKSEYFYNGSVGTADDGLVLAAGKDDGFFCTGAYLWKMDLDGNMVWKREFQMDDCLESIQVTSDKGLVVLGSYGTLVKLDENGQGQWAEVYNHPNSDYVVWLSVLQTADEGYAMVGTLIKQGGADGGAHYDIVVAKLDRSRKFVFRRKFSFTSPYVWGASILSAPGHGYFVFGLVEFNVLLLLNIDSQGLVPDCNSSHSISLRRWTLSAVESRTLRVKQPNSVSIKVHGFDLTEVAVDASPKTICK